MKEATFPDSFRTWQKLRLEQSGLGLIVPPKSSFPGISLVEDIDVIAALIQALSGVFKVFDLDASGSVTKV